MRIFLLSLIFITACVICLAQTSEPTVIVISTFFPTPNANFKNLLIKEGVIFKPHKTAGNYVSDLNCTNLEQGKLVYGRLDSTSTESNLYYCNGALPWNKL
jgi:hypothetical protein